MTNNERELVKDVLNRQADAAETSEVVKWFATDEGQLFLSDDIDETIDAMMQEEESDVAAFAPYIPSDKMLQRIRRQIRFRKARRVALRVAAVAIPVVLLLGFWLYRAPSDRAVDSLYTEVYVPQGEQKEVLLPDGSRVCLYADTHFRYPEQFSAEHRRVFLEGAGYFVVTKNPDRPFAVEMGEATVNVLGTSFNVVAYPEEEHIVLQLDEGSIKLTSPQEEYLMEPGDRLTYHRENHKCTVSKASGPSALEQWEENRFSFNNAALGEVLNTLEHWYGVSFQIGDEAALTYSYTFTSDKSSLQSILSDMEKVSPVRFTTEGNVIRVSLQ